VQVCAQAATDVQRVLAERYQERAIGTLNLDVASRLARLDGHRAAEVTAADARNGVKALGGRIG